MPGRVLTSVSTWQQPLPATGSEARAAVVDRLTAKVPGGRRVRVAIDGFTAAGKTTLGHELAERLASTDRTVLRASLDDFKRPWSERQLYDRTSGEGYYRNAF